MIDILPNVPSELVQVALDDLIAVENNPIYRIDMSTFHRKHTGSDECSICFAGATLANTLKLDPDTFVVTTNLPDTLHAKMWALNSFRVGAINDGLSYLGITAKQPIYDTYVKPYHRSPDCFKEGIRRVIALLKENGL